MSMEGPWHCGWAYVKVGRNNSHACGNIAVIIATRNKRAASNWGRYSSQTLVRSVSVMPVTTFLLSPEPGSRQDCAGLSGILIMAAARFGATYHPKDVSRVGGPGVAVEGVDLRRTRSDIHQHFSTCRPRRCCHNRVNFGQ